MNLSKQMIHTISRTFYTVDVRDRYGDIMTYKVPADTIVHVGDRVDIVRRTGDVATLNVVDRSYPNPKINYNAAYDYKYILCKTGERRDMAMYRRRQAAQERAQRMMLELGRQQRTPTELNELLEKAFGYTAIQRIRTELESY